MAEVLDHPKLYYMKAIRRQNHQAEVFEEEFCLKALLTIDYQMVRVQDVIYITWNWFVLKPSIDWNVINTVYDAVP